MDIRGLFRSRSISMLGGIQLEVISEKSIDSTMTIPTKRVENGFNISDSLRKDPLTFDITVVDNSNDYLLNRKALFELQENGILVNFYYAERDEYENIAVESITEIESNQQYQGFTYRIKLRQIQIAEILESDVQLDAKKAATSGGKKKVTTAKTTTPTANEVSKVRGSGVLKGAFNGLGGGI